MRRVLLRPVHYSCPSFLSSTGLEDRIPQHAPKILHDHWLLTITEQNFIISKQNRFSIQGFRQAQKRRVDRMQSGDRLMYYVSGLRVFALSATITSKAFKDVKPLWVGFREEEEFPYRVRIKPDCLLRDFEYLDAHQLAPRLEFLKRWPLERWQLAFIGELNLLSRKDYEMLEGEMLRQRDNRLGNRERRSRKPIQEGNQPLEIVEDRALDVSNESIA
ncbi:EVE domain-containing protein [SAR202 cluster bacterium AD-802-E10_MRT_200m]|nr:EVE domain-containing protein [SAR202 cluster bacterium AD-802-E10_MRT_200m]